MLGLTRKGSSSSERPGRARLGKAGTGKTHLLMRVARNLSGTNHILLDL